MASEHHHGKCGKSTRVENILGLFLVASILTILLLPSVFAKSRIDKEDEQLTLTDGLVSSFHQYRRLLEQTWNSGCRDDIGNKIMEYKPQNLLKRGENFLKNLVHRPSSKTNDIQKEEPQTQGFWSKTCEFLTFCQPKNHLAVGSDCSKRAMESSQDPSVWQSFKSLFRR